MKKLFFCLILTMLTVWQSFAADWGQVTNNFQMSISLKGDKNEIKTNQPCILSLRYKNTSTNETFWVYERNGTEHDPDYTFTVISPSGKDISPDMKHIRHGDSGGNIPVPPGQSIKIAFNLNELCKFDELGTYRIIAKKDRIWCLQKHEMFTVVSNPLNVIVLK